MGWTGILNAITKDNGSIDRRATLENIFGSWSNGDKTTKMLKSGMNGTTFYAAMETTTPTAREVWALVVLTSVSGREFCYKEMDETEGPYKYDCPAAILNMLTPTENENANAWREECRKQAAEKRKKGATIPRSATEIYITFKRDNNAAKAGETGTVYRRFDKWVYTDASGQSWRISAAMLHNPDFLTVNGTNADKPREEYEQTKIEFTEEAPAEDQAARPEEATASETQTETAEKAAEAPADHANEETPAETVKKPAESPQKAAKLCYNVLSIPRRKESAAPISARHPGGLIWIYPPRSLTPSGEKSPGRIPSAYNST